MRPAERVSCSALRPSLAIVLATTFFLAFLAHVASARVDTTFRVPYTALAGTCVADSECAQGSFCNDIGACEVHTSGRMYTRLLTNKTVIPVAIFGGLFMFFVVWLVGFWLSPAACRCNNDMSIHLLVLWCMGGGMCLVVSSLALGLTLGLWRVDVTPKFAGNGTACGSPLSAVCGGYYCDPRTSRCFTRCERDAQCVDGARCYRGQCYTAADKSAFAAKTARFSPGIVAVTAIFGSLGAFACCMCIALICHCNNDFNESLDWTAAFKSCAYIALVAVALGVGLGMGLARKADVPLGTRATNGTVCASDRQCAPYLCVPSTGMCADFCRRSSDCFSTFSCSSASTCERGQYGIDRRLLSTSGTVLTVVLVGVGVAMIYWAYCVANNPCSVFRYSLFERSFCFFLQAGVALLVWALVFGLPIGFSKSVVNPSTVGSGARCVDQAAVACSPYFCDVRTDQCWTSCKSNFECTGGTSCNAKTGRCVATASPSPASFNGAKRARLPGGAIAVIALAAPLPFICMLVLCSWLYERHDELNATEYDLPLIGRVCMPIVCVVVVLVVGLGLGLYQPKPAPSVGAPIVGSKFPTWLVLTLTMASTCGLCGLVLVISRLSMRVNWNMGVMATMESGVLAAQFFGAFMTLVLTFCVGALVFGLGFGFWRAVTPAAAGVPLSANGTECVATWDSKCAPFSCDDRSRTCRRSCTLNEECVAGSGCRLGVCTPAIQALPIGKRQGVVVIVGVTLAAFVCCWAFITGTAGWRPRARFLAGFNRFRAPLVVCSACCCGVMTATLVGLPLTYGLWIVPVPPSLVGTGPACAVIDALQCAPYFCDTIAERCFAACTRDEHCLGEEHVCRAGSCVARPLTTLRLSAWGVGLGLVLVLLLAVIIPPTCAKISQVRARRRLAAIEDLRRRAAEFREAQARIRKLTLDIEPLADQTYDPSLPTPLVRGAAAGPAFFGPDSPDGTGAAGVGGAGGTVTVLPLAEPAPDAEPELCAVCFFNPAVVRLAIRPLNGPFCGHVFCEACARDSLQMMVDTAQFPARCPGCRAEETQEDPDAPSYVRSLIPAGLVERLARRAVIAVDFARRFIGLQLMKALDPAELVMCPSCDLLAVKPRVDGKRGRDRTKATCRNCETEFCCECLSFWFEHKEYADCKAMENAKLSGNDAETLAMIAATSKACPNCSCPITHYRGHACHHIAPGTGCPNCGTHFCYECLAPYPCGNNGHGLFCDDNCHCPTCPVCAPGRPCPHCSNDQNCPACYPRNPPVTMMPDRDDDEPQLPVPRPRLDLPRVPHVPVEVPLDLDPELVGLDVPAGFWDPIVPVAAEPAPPVHAYQPLPVAARGLTFQEQIRMRGAQAPLPPPLPNPNWRRQMPRPVQLRVDELYARHARVRALPPALVDGILARRVDPDEPESPFLSAPAAAQGGAAAFVGDASGAPHNNEAHGLVPLLAPPPNTASTLVVTLPARPGSAGPPTGGSDGPPPLSPNTNTPLFERRGLGNKALKVTTPLADAAPDVSNIFNLHAFPQTARETDGRGSFARALDGTPGAGPAGSSTPPPGAVGAAAVIAPASARPNRPASWRSSMDGSLRMPFGAHFALRPASASDDMVVDPSDHSRLVPRAPLSARQARLDAFLAQTGVDDRTARNFLGLFNWDLAAALAYWTETRAITTPAGDADLRAAFAPTPVAASPGVAAFAPDPAPAHHAASEPFTPPIAAATPVAADAAATAGAATATAHGTVASSASQVTPTASSTASTPVAPPVHPLAADSSSSTSAT